MHVKFAHGLPNKASWVNSELASSQCQLCVQITSSKEEPKFQLEAIDCLYQVPAGKLFGQQAPCTLLYNCYCIHNPVTDLDPQWHRQRQTVLLNLTHALCQGNSL